jgi:hypothetical protein
MNAVNTPSFFQRNIQRFQEWRQENPLFGERLRAWGRLLILLFSPSVFALLGMVFFEHVNPLDIAELMRERFPLLQLFPAWLVMFLAPVTQWIYVRYLLAPIGVFLLTMLASALYVQEVYDLERFFPALRYIISSMFGILYPRVEIDGGKLKVPEGQSSVLERIGGPGFALIQPGNAVLFRSMRQPFRISLNRRDFMIPFESFGAMVDLNDQHGSRDEVWTVTRDGIQLNLRDVHFRYRLLTLPQGNGLSQPRTINNPYPFSPEVFQDFVYNRSAGDAWSTAVGRMIIGEIKDFIGSHDIDYLTAPRRNNQDPRRDLRMQLFTDGNRRRLRTIGTELLWIDVGHLEILEISDLIQENVDGQRLAYWASRGIGEANIALAQGEATRMALQERGRVEAQAELLQNITDALQGFEQVGDPAENLRKMILVRTAQILEGIGEVGRIPKEDP